LIWFISGFTPTHLAAQLENLTAMKLLVYGKADVNLADGKSGRTPLHHAVETDDLSLAAYLILQVFYHHEI
jgi:ankyrin repeat protein